MALKIQTIASGSKGNCAVISSGKANILLDIGLSYRELCCRLTEAGMSVNDIDAVIITHIHSDHTCGLPVFSGKHNIPVFAQEQTARSVRLKYDSKIYSVDEGDYFINDITVSPFKVSHDVHCVGYSFYCGGGKITMMTDLGVVTASNLSNAADSDIVILESNHDEELLKRNPKYSYTLKKRILSNNGHLSNVDCFKAATGLIKAGVGQIVLAHLSESNNTPELALSQMAANLETIGVTAGKDVMIDVAAQNFVSRVFNIH